MTEFLTAAEVRDLLRLKRIETVYERAKRGTLQPVNPGRRPLLFRRSDLIGLPASGKGVTENDRHSEEAWARVLARRLDQRQP